MRKHSLRLSVLLLTLLLVTVLALGLAACDPTPQTPDEPTPEEHTTHTPDSTTEWHSDDTDHWHLCVEGGEPIQKEAHDFELKNDDEHHYLECKVCHKIKDTEDHITVVKNDENGHWVECTKEGCTYATTPTEHTYPAKAVADADGEHHTFTCTYEGCGHTKQEGHDLSYEHIAEGGHHQICADCDYAGEKEDCAKAETAEYTDLKDGEHHTFVCEKCKETVTEAHDLGEWESDGANHYRVCLDCDATTNLGACTPKETYTTTADSHYKECTECGKAISSTRGQHSLEWKQDEKKENHYEFCPTCEYETEHQAHSTQQTKAEDIDGVSHGYTCEICELGYADEPHDYTGNSADCIDCGYDDGKWKFAAIDDTEEWKITGSTYAKLPKDEVTFPSLYKGKQVTMIAGPSASNDALSGGTFEKVVIPEGYTVIGEYAFYCSNIDDLYLPSSLTNIKVRSFGYPKTVSNAKGVRKNVHIVSLQSWIDIKFDTTNGAWALVSNNPFYGGQDGDNFANSPGDVELYVGEEHITDLVLPVTEEGEVKGDWRFMHLTSITLPENLKTWSAKIGYNSVAGSISRLCVSDIATYLNFATDIPYYVGKNGNVDVELYEGEAKVTELTIPTTVTTILNNKIRFKGVTKLTFEGTPTIGNAVISLPDCTQISVPSIEVLFTLNAGGKLFASFNGGKGVETYLGAEELTKAQLTEGTGDLQALSYISNLQQVIAGEGVTLDASKANLFAADSALQYVDFGKATLTLNSGKLGANAFKGCVELKRLVLPESVTGFENGQFEGADDLSRIFLKGDKDKASALAAAINASDSTALKLATVYAYYQADPGEEKGANELTWHYDEDGAVQLWDTEPECARHAFVFDNDNDNHWKKCSVCDYKLESTVAAHNLGDEIDGDENGHWQLCPECGAKAGVTGPHVTTKQQYESDGTQHWLICDDCGKIAGEKTPCSFDGDYTSDENEHWRECSVCHNEKHVPHNYTFDDEGFVDGICQDCGYSVWEFEGGAITAYNGKGIEKVAIPKTINGEAVTIIGKEDGTNKDTVFKYDCGIVEIKLPEGLLTIGAYAFSEKDSKKQLNTLTKVHFSSTITKICTFAFAYCKSLQDPELPKGLTVLEESVYSNCGESIENFTVPDGVTATYTKTLVPSYVRHLILGAGITEIAASGGPFSLSSCVTIEFKSEVTAIGDKAFQSAKAINVYFRNSVESLKPLLEATSSTYTEKLKAMNIYCYDASDPTGKEYDFGEYIDGTWREVDGKPSPWNVDYIMFDHGKSTSDPFTFDLNNGVDDKTLLLASYLYAASGELTYTSLSEGATITSSEGLATFTAPGTFKFKVALADNPDTFVELYVNVYSSGVYLVGNVDGKTYAEAGKDNSFEADSSVKFKYTGAFRAKDSFSINLIGSDLTIGKANVNEKYLVEEGEDAYYANNKITFEENGNITFGIAGDYEITVTYSFGTTFSISLNINRLNSIKAVHIAGRGSDALDEGVYFASSAENSDFTNDVTITVEWMSNNTLLTNKKYTNIAFVVEFTDGTLDWYTGDDGDDHALIEFSGSGWTNQGGDKYKWKTEIGSNAMWWGHKNMSTYTTRYPYYKWTFKFTLTADNIITKIDIAQESVAAS